LFQEIAKIGVNRSDMLVRYCQSTFSQTLGISEIFPSRLIKIEKLLFQRYEIKFFETKVLQNIL